MYLEISILTGRRTQSFHFKIEDSIFNDIIYLYVTDTQKLLNILNMAAVFYWLLSGNSNRKNITHRNQLITYSKDDTVGNTINIQNLHGNIHFKRNLHFFIAGDFLKGCNLYNKL